MDSSTFSDKLIDFPYEHYKIHVMKCLNPTTELNPLTDFYIIFYPNSPFLILIN